MRDSKSRLYKKYFADKLFDGDGILHLDYSNEWNVKILASLYFIKFSVKDVLIKFYNDSFAFIFKALFRPGSTV
jgi:hypothetical protein